MNKSKCLLLLKMKKSKVSFSQLISETNKKYDNSTVNIAILFYLSKQVKTVMDLMMHRKDAIDFNPKDYQQLLEDYYVKQKPLGQITHSARFNDLDLIVHPMVHTPRNETEYMTKFVQVQMMENRNLTHILDLCAGSGNIGISLKAHFPYTDLTLVEIDETSIKNIYDNLNKFKLDANVLHQDVFEFLKTNHPTKYDAIVMNPPYVGQKELNMVMTKYENKISFTNSSDPLAFYKALLENLSHIINPDHFLIACEFGYNQKQELSQLVKTYHLDQYTTFYQDLNQKDRFFIIKK